jgi:hypothetical protein
VIRKLFTATLALATILGQTSSLSACSNQSYVQLYNYSEKPLKLYLDGVEVGEVAPSSAPHWIPAPFGLHKVEVYTQNSWSSTYKYCETSYSYPNAYVTFNTGDI